MAWGLKEIKYVSHQVPRRWLAILSLPSPPYLPLPGLGLVQKREKEVKKIKIGKGCDFLLKQTLFLLILCMHIFFMVKWIIKVKKFHGHGDKILEVQDFLLRIVTEEQCLHLYLCLLSPEEGQIHCDILYERRYWRGSETISGKLSNHETPSRRAEQVQNLRSYTIYQCCDQRYYKCIYPRSIYYTISLVTLVVQRECMLIFLIPSTAGL